MTRSLCNHGILGTYYALALLRFGGTVERGIENGAILIMTLSSIRAVNQVLSLAKTLSNSISIGGVEDASSPYLPGLLISIYIWERA